MTDIELTRACAEAAIAADPSQVWLVNALKADDGSGRTGMHWYGYEPLVNKAQCFELIGMFDMVIEREKDKSFGVTIFHGCYRNGKPTSVVRNQPDLSRAIVQAVAAMHAARK